MQVEIYEIYCDFLAVRVISLYEKTIVEANSVAINFDQHLTNIFLKSTKVKRCRDIIFKQTL